MGVGLHQKYSTPETYVTMLKWLKVIKIYQLLLAIECFCNMLVFEQNLILQLIEQATSSQLEIGKNHRLYVRPR